MKRGTGILAVLVALAAALVAASIAPASSPTAGQLDPAYGSGGAVLDDFYGTQDADQANAVAIQPDGKIVIAGATTTGGFGPLAMVARYNANGSRDSSFGPPPHGFMKEQVCFGGTCGAAEADAVAIIGNGDIVVAGVAVNNGCFFVMRLTSSGALDSTFAQAGSNGAGVAAFRLGAVTVGYHVGGVAVQSDGSIVVDGTFNSPTQGFIARIPSGGGVLDTAGWNNPNGYTTDASTTSFSALALQPSDGKAVAVGTDSSTHEVRIVRFTTAGAQDTTTFHAPFGANEARIGGGPDSGAALVATADGRLIVAGTDQTGSAAGIGLFQFRQSDGALDPSFAGGSGERLALPGGDAASVTALALDGTGRLLVAGQDTTTSHMFVARLSAAGALDPSFGAGGFALPTTIGASDGAQGVAADAAGNPVVGGFGTPQGAPDTDALTARLLATTPPTPPTTTTTTTTTSTAPTASAPAAPTISQVSQTNSKWREGSMLARFARARKPPVGTTFSFTLNVPSSVSLAFTQRLPGRRVGRPCVAPTRSNRGKPGCTRTVARGTLRFSGHTGVNKVFFQGRLSRTSKLGPGRYSLVITAANSAGQRSSPATLAFTVVK